MRDKKVKPSIITSQNSLILSFKMVFSRWLYIIIAVIVASVFWILFSIFDQLLFFSPIVIFYLPDDAIVSFVISNITAILLGIVISMNIYVFKYSKLKINIAPLFSWSSISVISSACASCSSFGLLFVSTLGGIGLTTLTFLSNYQTPLRLVSIMFLIWAYYSISNKLTKSCIINYNNEGNKV
ncbi:MAG: hypothetical protein ACM3VV_01150 [Deltaproteobacteria bacterium]